LPLQLRLSRSASFPLKANQRKEMAAGWLHCVFSVICLLMPPIAHLFPRVQSLADFTFSPAVTLFRLIATMIKAHKPFNNL